MYRTPYHSVAVVGRTTRSLKTAALVPRWSSLAGMLLVCFAPALAAEIDQSMIGKNLVMTRRGVQLQFTDPATGGNKVVGTIEEAEVRLDKIQGTWLWVRTPTRAGWIKRGDAVPGDQAVAYFTRRLQENPNDSYAYNQRSAAWLKQYELDKALDDVNQAIRLSPQDAVSRHNRGVIWSEKKEYQRAIADYDESLRMRSNYPLSYCHRGEAYYALGKYDKALADFTEAIRQLPGYAAAFSHRGHTWLKKKEYEIALADFSDAIRLDTKLAHARHGRGQCYHYLGQYDKAVADYDRAIELQPAASWMYRDRGSAWFDQKKYKSAIDNFDEALRLNGDDAFSWIRRGQCHYFQKNYDQALADYNAALRLRPSWSDVFNNRGWLWLAEQQFEKARHDFDEAIRLNPDNTYSYRGRGRAFRKLGDDQRALADFDELVRRAPSWPYAYFERAELRFARNEFDRAMEDYSAAIRHDPKFTAAYTARAVTRRRQRDFERAIADLNEAIRLAPQNWTAFFQRANTYRWMNQYDPAIDDYNQAFRLNPSHAGIIATRGYAYFLNQQYDKALADFDRAEQLDPKHGWAYRNRAMFFATCPDEKHRNLKKARDQLAKARQFLPPAADLFEAEAAVAAESGDFDAAVRWQQRLLQIPAWGVIPEMQARLEVYRNHHPYRQGMVLTAYAAPSPDVPAAVPAEPPLSIQPDAMDPTPMVEPAAALLQGTWVCVLTLKDGDAVDNYVGVRAVIEGDRLTWFFPRQDGTYSEQACRFRIDAKQDPKHFDWWPVDNPESVDRRIYSVSDGALRWATNLDGKTRPASFDSARWQFTTRRLVDPEQQEGRTDDEQPQPGFDLPADSSPGAIESKVAKVDDQMIAIHSVTGRLPAVGDKVGIFVEVPGVGKASVATATVSNIKDKLIWAKIDTATGTVRQGQTAILEPPHPVSP